MTNERGSTPKELTEAAEQLLAVVDMLAPILLRAGSFELCRVIREQAADTGAPKQAMREACEVARVLGNLEGQYLGRWGESGEPRELPAVE